MSVKRTNKRQLASILLILFLLASILSQSSASFGSYLKSFGYAIAKAKTRSASDFQFPYEKNEKEEKHSTEDRSVFICIIPDSELSIIFESNKYSSYTDFEFFGNSVQTPVYLFNKTLLI